MANDVYPALQAPYGLRDYAKLKVGPNGELLTSATGTFNYLAPTGPVSITVSSVTPIAMNPLVAPFPDRVDLSIRNKGPNTIYYGPTAGVTADDMSTGGWEILKNEDFHIELNDSQVFYLITAAGESAVVKILEIAST